MRVLAAAVLALVVATPSPQDPRPEPSVLQKAKQVSATTEQHARLARLVGQWDVVLRTTLPGGKEQQDTGRVVVAAILGGRYVVANYSLQIQGVKVEAVQMFGFDALRSLFTASWRDDLSTWSIETAGPPVAATPDRLTLLGTMVDAKDPTGRPFRQVVDLADDKAVTVRLYDTHDEKEFELQVQQWTRRQ